MDSTIAFLGGMFGTRAVEIAAVALGLINIVLIVRRSVWNYPFGIAMVILYAWIFWQARLYAEAALQVYFLIVQGFGWYWWLAGRGGDGRVVVLRASPAEMAACAGIAVAGALALGAALARYTDAAYPYWDAAVAALSVVAQYLLARRWLDSWAVWIAVDVLAIGLYVTKGLYPTAVLYALFLGLATAGLVAWRQSWRRGAAAAMAA